MHITSTNAINILCDDNLLFVTSTTTDNTQNDVLAAFTTKETLVQNGNEYDHDLSFALQQYDSEIVDIDISSKIYTAQLSNIDVFGETSGFATTHVLTYNTSHTAIESTNMFNVLCGDDIWSLTSNTVDEHGDSINAISAQESLVQNGNEYDHDLSFSLQSYDSNVVDAGLSSKVTTAQLSNILGEDS